MHGKWVGVLDVRATSSGVSSSAYLCFCVLFRFFFDKVRFLALFLRQTAL